MKITHLMSGELQFSEQDEIFQTVLGSCISICVHDRVKKIGGMIHFLLPERSLAAQNSNICQNPLNFADEAIVLLLKEFKKRNSNPTDLAVYQFGGGRQVVHDMPVFSSLPNIGMENIKFSQTILNKFNLKIAKQKVGHQSGAMLVRFNPHTGAVCVAYRNSVDKSFKKLGNKKTKCRVLVVDDSAPIRKIISRYLIEDPNIEVVGEARDAFEAEKLRVKLKPDVMTLDIQMPKKDGVSYLRDVLRISPMPIIMISDLSLNEVSPVMEALEAGAFDYLQKPSLSEVAKFSDELKSKIHSAGMYGKKIFNQFQNKLAFKNRIISAAIHNRDVELIAIGASTGGIEALRQVFSQLPPQTPPIIIVQHIPPVFSAAFAERLNKLSQITVKEAADGDYLQNNHAYIAPGGQQMKIEKKNGRMLIRITDDAPVNRFKPSVDYMFESLCKLDNIKKMRIGILTGMGDDGARGMLKLKQLGAKTIAQNEESCVVYGMPKAAVDLKAASAVLDLYEIAPALLGVAS